MLRLAKIDIRYDWIAHHCYSAIQTNLFLFLLPFSPSHLLFPSGRLADGALASPGTILWNDYCVTDVMCLESVYVTGREKGRWSTLHLIGMECGMLAWAQSLSLILSVSLSGAAAAVWGLVSLQISLSQSQWRYRSTVPVADITAALSPHITADGYKMLRVIIWQYI